MTFFSARAFTFFFDLAFIWLAVDILKFNADYPVTILRSTAENPKAVYACLNYNEAVCPKQIEKQSICIDGDSGEVLQKLC